MRDKNLLSKNPSLMDSIALYWSFLFLVVLRLEEQVVVCPVYKEINKIFVLISIKNLLTLKRVYKSKLKKSERYLTLKNSFELKIAKCLGRRSPSVRLMR